MEETIKYDREVLIEILIYHYRKDSSSCGCGWGELGRSHCAHVADVYEACIKANRVTLLRAYKIEITKDKRCKFCGATQSVEGWWKCCPKHTTEQGEDVVCHSCAIARHPEGLKAI